MNDCMSEIEIDVLVPKMLFSFPCPNIWLRSRSIKMAGQHKCVMARKAVIRYAIISETLMMGKIEISSTAWFVSLNRDKKSGILVDWSLSNDLIPIRSKVRMLLWWLLQIRCILYVGYVVVLWTVWNWNWVSRSMGITYDHDHVLNECPAPGVSCDMPYSNTNTVLEHLNHNTVICAREQ